MKKLLIGCGVVVGLALVALVVTSVLIGNYVSKNLPDTERIERLEATMEEQFGLPEDYVPPLDGAYDPERIALYVQLRSRFVEDSRPIADAVAALTSRSRGRGEERSRWAEIKSAVSGVRSGIGIFRESIEFLATADSILLDAGMGKGEYNHYNLITLMNAMPDSLHERLLVVRESETHQLAAEFAEQGRDMVLDQLDNARKAIARLENPSDAELAWRERLGEELRLCRNEPKRWPFAGPDDVPFAAHLETHGGVAALRMPRDIPSFLAEMPLAMKVDTDGGGFQVTF